MRTIVLIQPASAWGQHPYLPNGLLSVAARLTHASVTARIIDLNIDKALFTEENEAALRHADAIGIGCLGSPYIPRALDVALALRQRGFWQPIAIGGEPILRMTRAQFDRIFTSRIGGDVRQAGGAERGSPDPARLAEVFETGPLPSMYDISMRPAIEALPLRYRQAYFSRELCIFTSQGCKFDCDFCGASKAMRETFRSHEAFADEVDCLFQQIATHAGPRPSFEGYCSTLDGLQNWQKMEQILRIIHQAQERHRVRLPLRFLATSSMTVEACQEDPDVLHRWKNLGVGCIGLGVDGDDEEDWLQQNKWHNKRVEVESALQMIAAAGMVPEALMIIGFPGSTEKAVHRSVAACMRHAFQGRRVRPYLGKSHAPGGKWWDENHPSLEQFFQNPYLFLELDYAGIASPVTHPDPALRGLANRAYLGVIARLNLLARLHYIAHRCPTMPLFPTQSVSYPLGVLAKWANHFMPADR